jgi:hypothetical protein
MSTPDVVSNGITFEVERFEWVDGDRLEVSGRWYGLRGHRFVRPVLVVQAVDERRRMLAVLDHKPWAAEDGDEWIAAFPWEGEPLELTAAELAVAPSLAVDLPVPRVPGKGSTKTAPSEGPLHARRGPAQTNPEPAEATPPTAPKATKPAAPKAAKPAAPKAAKPATPNAAKPATPKAAKRAAPPASAAAEESVTPEEVAALRAQLASEQASVRRLATQLEEAHQGLAAARSAADDHDALVRERDAAIAGRDEARANANLDHDAVIEERDQAVHERAAALYARDEALDERAAANFERKNAIAERDAAVAERDRAIEAHRAAVRDLEALEKRVAAAEQARAQEVSIEPSPAGAVRVTPGRDPDARERHGLVWVQRVVALIVLFVWAIVVYKVLHGIV